MIILSLGLPDLLLGYRELCTFYGLFRNYKYAFMMDTSNLGNVYFYIF